MNGDIAPNAGAVVTVSVSKPHTRHLTLYVIVDARGTHRAWGTETWVDVVRDPALRGRQIERGHARDIDFNATGRSVAEIVARCVEQWLGALSVSAAGATEDDGEE